MSQLMMENAYGLQVLYLSTEYLIEEFTLNIFFPKQVEMILANHMSGKVFLYFKNYTRKYSNKGKNFNVVYSIDFSKSSEYVSTDGPVVKGPDLIVKESEFPAEFFNHCMVELKNGSIMIMGAKYYHNKTFLFNPNTKEFIRFHDMLRAREFAGCALFNSPKHGDRSVVAIGGGENKEATIEILDYTKEDSTWEISKNHLIT